MATTETGSNERTGAGIDCQLTLHDHHHDVSLLFGQVYIDCLQVSHTVSLPFSIIDAAAKSLELATAQSDATCLASCNQALISLQALLHGCPANQAIKVCTAALHAVVQICSDRADMFKLALAEEVFKLLGISVDLLASAEGVYGSRSWQAFTTALVPAAIAGMWSLPSAPALAESVDSLAKSLKASLQAVLSHSAHLLVAAKEFQLMAADLPAVHTGDTATAATAKKQQKLPKQHHANGVLSQWQLVQDLADGQPLTWQQRQTVRNVHLYFAWLIRLYHRCFQEVSSHTAVPVPNIQGPNKTGTTGLPHELVRALPWHVLCVILHRGLDIVSKMTETSHSQEAACIALAVCAESLKAAQDCNVCFSAIILLFEQRRQSAPGTRRYCAYSHAYVTIPLVTLRGSVVKVSPSCPCTSTVDLVLACTGRSVPQHLLV